MRTFSVDVNFRGLQVNRSSLDSLSIVIGMSSHSELLHTARNVLHNEVQALQRVSDRLSDTFVDAVALLQKADRVFVFGIGKSSLIGAKFSATLSSIGKPAQSIHPVDALHGDIGNVTPGSCAVFISKSATTPELLEIGRAHV